MSQSGCEADCVRSGRGPNCSHAKLNLILTKNAPFIEADRTAQNKRVKQCKAKQNLNWENLKENMKHPKHEKLDEEEINMKTLKRGNLT